MSPVGLPGGYEVVTSELHTGNPVRIIGFYPRTRKQRSRALGVVELLHAAHLPGWVDEVGAVPREEVVK